MGKRIALLAVVLGLSAYVLVTAVNILIRQEPATAVVVASGGLLLLFLRYRKKVVARHH